MPLRQVSSQRSSPALAPDLQDGAALLDSAGLSQLFKACGDPLRLQILQVLKHDTFGVLELTQLFETKQSGMSHHLKVLSNAGLVEAQREGNAIFYRRPFQHQTTGDFHAIDQLLAIVDRRPLDSELEGRIARIREQRAEQSRAFFDRNIERFSEQQEMICDYEQYAEASFALLQKSGLDKASLILELGPGEGRFLKPLSLNYTQVVALDTSETLLAKASRFAESEGLKNIEFIHGDSSQFLQLDRQVDAVIMNMVLHHVPAPAKIFEDSYEILRHGGVMVICDLMSHHNQDWAREKCGDLWLGLRDRRTEYLGDPDRF